MAGRGQVSWLPGLVGRTFPGTLCRPQWLTLRVGDFLDPVTVAGPLRTYTGLPLTTDRLRGRVYPACVHPDFRPAPARAGLDE